LDWSIPDSATGSDGFRDKTFGGFSDKILPNLLNIEGGFSNKKCVFKYIKISKIGAFLYH